MAESFWAIPDVTDVVTPLSILREQAAAITQQTKGTLVGIVEFEHFGAGRIAIELQLSVPALNDYRYKILSYEQPLELYPGRIYPNPVDAAGTKLFAEVPDEEAFVSAVKDILSSDRVKKALTALLAQVR